MISATAKNAESQDGTTPVNHDRPFPLTRRQLDALRYIAGFQQAKGFCPSLREIMEGIDLHSHSRVSSLVDGLEERGHIRRQRGRWRSIEILYPHSIPRDPSGRPLYFVRAE